MYEKRHHFFLQNEELVQFLGLTIICGVLQGENQPLSTLFRDVEYGRNIFKQTMATDKYKKH